MYLKGQIKGQNKLCIIVQSYSIVNTQLYFNDNAWTF